MIQILLPPVPMPTEIRITLSVVLLGLIVLGVIFIPKALKYRKRMLENPEPKEPEEDKPDDVVMMIVDEEDSGKIEDTDNDNNE